MISLNDVSSQGRYNDNLSFGGDSSACISSILEKEFENFSLGNPECFDNLKIYPMYVEFSPSYLTAVPFFYGERKPKKRGKITGVSADSARRLKKRIGRAGELNLWVDFTFADDVIKSKTVTEKAVFSAYCMKRLMAFAKSEFNLYLIWKREYQKRKSGSLKGELCPHFHCLLGGLKKGVDYEYVCVCLLREWVRLTGTKEVDKALKVALHRKNGSPSSYRRIENQKHAICYVSKYFSKDDKGLKLQSGESIGRCWGCTDNCPDIPPICVELSFLESQALRDALIEKKGIVRKSDRDNYFYDSIKGYGKFFIFDPVDDFLELLDSIRDEYCPF